MAFRPLYRSDDPFWRGTPGTNRVDEPWADFINRYKNEVVKPSAGYSIATDGYGIASGEDFERGDLVRLDGSDNVVELTAITQTVKGVAMEPVVAGLALGPVTDRVVLAHASYTNLEPTYNIVKNVFAVPDVNGTTPLTTHIGDEVVLDLTAGDWTIDVSNTSNTDVEIVGIDTVRDEFHVKFLDAIIQS